MHLLTAKYFELKKMEDFKMNYLLLAFMWTAYCALHSYLISISFTNLMHRLLKEYYAFYRLFYVLVSVFTLIPIFKYSALDSNAIIIYGQYLNIARYILMSGSLLMFIWAFFFDYDSLHFFGVRQMLTFRKTKETNPSNEIKRSGFLGIVRHPMYFAVMVYLLCRMYTMADIIMSSVLIVYTIIGTMLEEKKLVLEFGETYIKYQNEVPMLIPFTKAK